MKDRPAARAKRPARRVVDRDGVVRVEQRRGGLPIGPIVVFALAACALGLLALFWRRESSADGGPPQGMSGRTTPASAPARLPPGARLRLASRAASLLEGASEPAAAEEQPPDPEDELSQDEREDDGPDEDAPAGKAGIFAFPAPGTKRLRAGLVVPDDFELPPGYVRHYQATDKGKMLEPILLFHPDYELVDASGAKLPLPEGRVVPPEMAPQGMSQRTLEIPKDAYATRDDEGPGPETDPGQTGHEDDEDAVMEP